MCLRNFGVVENKHDYYEEEIDFRDMVDIDGLDYDVGLL